MPHLFADAIHRALTTDHAALTLTAGSACKYPADIAPFAAINTPTVLSMESLHSLLHPGEETWLYAPGPLPPHPGLRDEETLACLQMAFPATASLPTTDLVPTTLSCNDAPAMIALTEIAFPGFFRPRTCEMGRYYGFWHDSQLVAMGGERLNFTADGHSFHEISGLCTHPSHRGKGYGAALLAHLLYLHRDAGQTSWLHVSTVNPARHLYTKLGFLTANEVTLHRLRRIDEASY